uniref:Bacteriocin immunity protein n=1 Tax=Strongyloides venezuelensis TaxID=75913 RepID=A0A0K0FPW0_STRVS
MEAQKAYIKSIFKKLSDYTRSKTPKELFGDIIEEIPADYKDDNKEIEEKKWNFLTKKEKVLTLIWTLNVSMPYYQMSVLLRKELKISLKKTQYVKEYASECLSIFKKIKI